ncbi:MAG: hypothetical protein IJD13_09950, partial [Oscillospiraceae bacterium]|nr:hypothetical protein [Oscillospiraceae bacterium]
REIANRYGTVEEKEPSYIPIERLMGANRSPVAPGAKYVFDDWHPVTNSFNARRYTLIFRTPSGGEVRKDIFFELDKGPFLQVDPNAPLAPVNMGGEMTWHFESYFTNTTGAELTLKKLTITDLKGGNKGGKAVIPVERLMNLQMNRVPAGGYFYHDDWHPVADIFDGRIYTYEFAKSTGGTFEYTTTFRLTDQMSAGSMNLPDYSGDNGKNVGPMNHGAGFEVQVAKDVYWVPAASLGKSDLTNAAVYSMLSDTPEVKQQKIDTLYEALQLYRISGFFASDDNIRIQERGINWEHHKPGYYAVLSNNGCCATDSNWLNYILKGDYEEVGFMAYSHTDGSGHIFNYIKSGGWYYFIDLTAHRAADSNCAFETGSMTDYYNSNSILGNIHKAKTPEAYVNYLRGSFGSNAPGLFFLYRAGDCLAVDGIRDGTKTEIVYGLPSDVSVRVVYDNPSDKLTYRFTTPPSNLPDWSKSDRFQFP